MSEETSARIDNLARQVLTHRRRPLLVLFYDESLGRISWDDVEDIYDEFRRHGWRMSRRGPLDVLIHSTGGNADASYRIAQVIRNFATDVHFLVPLYATSGATLVCLSGNQIRLGPYAFLGPIDIQIGDVELASIDSFRDFAVNARREVEEILDRLESPRTTDVESTLLRELVQQEHALDIGSLVRESSLTGYYANRLLHDYMFKDESNREAMARDNANQLLSTFPSHLFVLDYHMADSYLKLKLEEMGENEFDRLRGLVDELESLTEQGVICKDIGEEEGETVKAPFIRLYPGGRGG